MSVIGASFVACPFKATRHNIDAPKHLHRQQHCMQNLGIGAYLKPGCCGGGKDGGCRRILRYEAKLLVRPWLRFRSKSSTPKSYWACSIPLDIGAAGDSASWGTERRAKEQAAMAAVDIKRIVLVRYNSTHR